MTSRERVLTALRCNAPDRVPRCEFGIDRGLAQELADAMGAPCYSLSELRAASLVQKVRDELASLEPA